jgi:hypothetical protein
MRSLLLYFFFLFCCFKTVAQLEFTTGYAVNRRYADGAPLQIAYDVKIGNGFFTKPQIGFKYLYHFDDFVGAKLKVSIWEFHQTLSYELIKKSNYILKPNVGINFRKYTWRGQMVEPLNSLPGRQYVIGFRSYYMVLNSYGNNYTDEYSVSNFGFTFQLQNQFRLNDKLWIHITPFLEPDYDRIQNTGGCYVGLIFKQSSLR